MACLAHLAWQSALAVHLGQEDEVVGIPNGCLSSRSGLDTGVLKKWSQLAAVALAQELLSGLPLVFGRRILWQPMLLGLFHDGIQSGLRMVWQLRLELQQLLKLGFFGGWLQCTWDSGTGRTLCRRRGQPKTMALLLLAAAGEDLALAFG